MPTPTRRRRIPILLALALALACQSAEERRAEHLAAADAYLEARDERSALIELRNALKLDPGSAEINARLARVLEDLRDFQGALFFWEEAHRLAPESNEYALALAKVLMRADRERAAELIETVQERSPDEALVHVRRSELALIEADTTAALEAALVAAELEPDDVDVQAQLAVVQLGQIRELQLQGEEVPDALFEDGLAAFERALELAKQDETVEQDRRVRFQLERARLFAVWGRREEAAETYRTAYAEAGDWPELQQPVVDAGLAYASSVRDPDLRIWLMERQIEFAPERVSAWSALAAAKDPQDAETSAVLTQLIETRPADPAAQSIYAIDLARRQGLEAAMAHVKRVAEETTDPPEVWATLAALEGTSQDTVEEIAVRLERDHPGDADTHMVRGRVEMMAGRYQQAADAFTASLQVGESVEGYRLLAEMYRRMGEPARGLDALQRAIELEGEPTPLRLLRTRALFEVAVEDWQAAIATYRQIRQRQRRPLGAGDSYRMAQALYGVNRAQQARGHLMRAVTADPPPLSAVLLYASQEGANDPDHVREVLTTAARAHPESHALVEALARLDLMTGNPERARARLDERIEEAPHTAPNLRVARARLRAQEGDLDGALEDARAAIEAAPNNRDAVGLLVGLLAARNEVGEAIATLEQEDRDGKLSLSSRVLLARLQLGAGNPARAMELYEEALEERSDLPGVKNDLAYLLAGDGGDLERALQLAREARQALPRSGHIADTLGWIYLKKGLPGPAADQFREAVSLTRPARPEWSTFHYHLGLALKAQGREADAVEAFEKALASAAEFPEVEDTRRELASLRGEAG